MDEMCGYCSEEFGGEHALTSPNIPGVKFCSKWCLENFTHELELARTPETSR